MHDASAPLTRSPGHDKAKADAIERPASTSGTPETRVKAWSLLFLAAVFEIVFAVSTNATEGFTKLVPSVITILAVAASIFFLTKALRTLDVGVGYTVWTGIGSVGTVILGSLIFEESLSPAKIACFVLIIGGVVGLHQSDRKADRKLLCRAIAGSAPSATRPLSVDSSR